MAPWVKRCGAGLIVLVALASTAPALAASGTEPWFALSSGARPSSLAPGASGEIVATAENVGNANVEGAGTAGPVTLTDTLPAGLEATGVAASEPVMGSYRRAPLPCVQAAKTVVSCTLAGSLPPYGTVEVRIAVKVTAGAKTAEENVVHVSGGEAPSASTEHAVTVSADPPAFGVEDYELVNEEVGGDADVRAGSHPFQQTTTITVNQSADLAPLSSAAPVVTPVALPKNLSFQWPAGMIGDPIALPRCTLVQFSTVIDSAEENECPAQTAVGVVSLTAYEPASLGMVTFTEPLFNLEPLPGEPARFGFYVASSGAPAFIDTALRTGGDYGLTVSTDNITQTAGFLSARVTMWGEPGDPSHDSERGWGCLAVARGVEHGSPCDPVEELHPVPFLSLPSSCAGPQQSTIEGDSWAQANELGVDRLQVLARATLPALDGCDHVPFAADLSVASESSQASSPSGLTFNLRVPQEAALNPSGVGASSIRELALELPAGVTLNPALADGLDVCSEAQIGYLPDESATSALRFTAAVPACPNAAKIGTVKLETPILTGALEGAVYMAAQDANPFSSLAAIYIVAEDPTSGALVKLAGEVSLDPQTGQLTVTLENAPQLPLEEIQLSFFGGERAPLSTPAHCGTYTTIASLVPWSGTAAIDASASFQIAAGPGDGAQATPCPSSPLTFSPSLVAGTTNNRAASFAPLTATVGREDGQQDIQSIQLRFPAGLSAVLAGVRLCPEAQANAGTCPAESEVGQTTISAGLGVDPYTVTGGRAYLTGPYQGAPFGLSIVSPVRAGPFDLERNSPCDCLIVRARIEVDPMTAAFTVTTGAIPRIVEGFPLQLKHINITIDRRGFTFNPTNCAPLAIAATIDGGEGATAAVSAPFQSSDCTALRFTPKLTALTRANGEFAGHGASLHVAIAGFAGQANMRSLKLDLPQRLPARLGAIQRACREVVFHVDPAACPKASAIGSAAVATPLLSMGLRGPAYLVARGAKSASSPAFPEIVLDLQGDGVRIDLVGEMYVNERNITSVTFKALPDVPISRLDLILPEGGNSILAASGSLCAKRPLIVSTAITAQNNEREQKAVKVAVEGCGKLRRRRR